MLFARSLFLDFVMYNLKFFLLSEYWSIDLDSSFSLVILIKSRTKHLYFKIFFFVPLPLFVKGVDGK